MLPNWQTSQSDVQSGLWEFPETPAIATLVVLVGPCHLVSKEKEAPCERVREGSLSATGPITLSFDGPRLHSSWGKELKPPHWTKALAEECQEKSRDHAGPSTQPTFQGSYYWNNPWKVAVG